MHFPMQCFHCSKHAMNSSSLMPLSATVKFFWMSSMFGKRWLLRALLILRNKKKSHVVRSSEYGGWSNTFTWFFVKKSQILKAEYMGALSWWNNKELFAHKSGQTWRIHSRRHWKMFKYSSAFIVVFWGRNSLWIRSFLLKNATSILFTCILDILAFFGLALSSPTRCILWCLVSGLYSKSLD